MQTIDPHAVCSHYSQGQLAVRLIEALRLAGKNMRPMMENVLRNFDERCMVVIQGVFTRP